jgi:hypothetical protein
VSRVIGAAESAERDKFNAERRSEVRLATPHSGTGGSEVDGSRRGGKGSKVAAKGRARASAAALSPIEAAYATKPCEMRSSAARAACALQPTRFCRDSDTGFAVSSQRAEAAAVGHSVRSAAAGPAPPPPPPTPTAGCDAPAQSSQDYFDARLRRKTDAVTGRVSKYAAENNRLWTRDVEQQMTNSLGLQLHRFRIMLHFSSDLPPIPLRSRPLPLHPHHPHLSPSSPRPSRPQIFSR